MRQLLRGALKATNALIKPTGLAIARNQNVERYPDVDDFRKSAFERIKHLSPTSPERAFTLCDAIAHIVRADIPGCFVECGVFKGGSSMIAAMMLKHLGAARDMHLYDTFAGMPPPSENDVDVHGNSMLDAEKFFSATGKPWTMGTEDEVRENMASTGYDMSRVHMHKGLVENTIPSFAPETISVLRLDTDWYKSTKHELIHLWPRLSPGGLLIIDDYGHFLGARKAVDEFFSANPIFLFRVDYTVRMAIKPA